MKLRASSYRHLGQLKTTISSHSFHLRVRAQRRCLGSVRVASELLSEHSIRGVGLWFTACLFVYTNIQTNKPNKPDKQARQTSPWHSLLSVTNRARTLAARNHALESRPLPRRRRLCPLATRPICGSILSFGRPHVCR